MPDDHADSTGDVWYAYAIVRVVPRVERGEDVNVGVVLFAATRRMLEARVELDPGRVRALDPTADLDLIARHLRTFSLIAAGDPAGGEIAALSPSERFHWLTAPRSTVIQTSPVHEGCSSDPRAALEELMDAYVRLPASGGSSSAVPSENLRSRAPGD